MKGPVRRRLLVRGKAKVQYYKVRAGSQVLCSLVFQALCPTGRTALTDVKDVSLRDVSKMVA